MTKLVTLLIALATTGCTLDRKAPTAKPAVSIAPAAPHDSLFLGACTPEPVKKACD